MSSVLKSLVELARASNALLMAKLRARTNPCPPHDYTHRWGFCEKCGARYDDEP